MTRTTGPDGTVIQAEYDLAGRKVKTIDPNLGTWEYAYNALGELTRQLDSMTNAIDFEYDMLGRITDRYEQTSASSLDDPNAALVNHQMNSFDNSVSGHGLPVSVEYSSVDEGRLQFKEFEYDGFGRITQVTTTSDNTQASEITTYDEFGRVFQQFDASGDDNGIRYHYHNGYLERLQEARDGKDYGIIYQEIVTMDARNNVTHMLLGIDPDPDNPIPYQISAEAEYEPITGRIESLTAIDQFGQNLQSVTYTFDVVGNLMTRSDNSGSGIQARDLLEIFTYEYQVDGNSQTGLNRLAQVDLSQDGGTEATTLTLAYDFAGNITDKSDVGSNWEYGVDAGPHAVTSAGGTSYTYDANGNQISGDGRTLEHSTFNKVTLIEKDGRSTQFKYGIDNRRMIREDFDGVNLLKRTEYFGNVERIDDGNSIVFKRYIGGVAIAEYDPSNGGRTRTYLVKDHLGSIHSALEESDQSEDPMWRDFSAFGERRDSDWVSTPDLVATNELTTRGFTGHEHVDDFGIIHMNGRIYDPKLGRFLQADPIVQDLRNSQSLNRYSYVWNNPLSHTDPSGYEVVTGAAAATSAWFILNAAHSLFNRFSSNSDDAPVVATGRMTAEMQPGLVVNAFNNMPRKRRIDDCYAGSATCGGAVWNMQFTLKVQEIAEGSYRQTASVETGGKFGSGISQFLDSYQEGLDYSGLAPGVGILPDAFNTGISVLRGDWEGAYYRAGAMVPFFGQGVTTFKLASKNIPARFIGDSAGNIIDRAAVKTTISAQRQARHVRGTSSYSGGGYFRSQGDAQRVLDDFHSGSAEVLGVTRSGNIVVRNTGVQAFNNNAGAGYVDQATDVFFIKGTKSPSVVPANPNWTP